MDRPRGYSVTRTDVTDANEIIKPKCQGLSSDMVLSSHWSHEMS